MSASLRPHLCSSFFLAAVLASGGAYAERPMAVDDASTMDRGASKIEFGWSRDDQARGWDGAIGHAPIDGLEAEVGFARLRDHDESPATTVKAAGVALKWVPLQAETGLSAGLKYEYVDERVKRGADADAHALTALFTWTFASGPAVHANLGHEWLHVRGEGRENLGTWGIGLNLPLNEVVEFAIETFGAEHSGPDRQVGLRYAIADGVKVSTAFGRGNGRNFGNAGVAWEF